MDYEDLPLNSTSFVMWKNSTGGANLAFVNLQYLISNSATWVPIWHDCVSLNREIDDLVRHGQMNMTKSKDDGDASNPSVHSLNERLVSGSESIAFELDRQFRHRLCELVDRRMNEIYKRRQDPEDIVQSVFKSFYVRAANGEFEFENKDSLWNLLQRIARNKMLKKIQKDRAEKRDITREVISDSDCVEGASLTSAQAHILAEALELALNGLGSPTPEIFQLQLYGYTVAEVIEKVLHNLEPPYPQILKFRLEGCSEQEIAAQLGCLRGKVRYKLRRLQQRLRELLKVDSE